MNTSQLKKTQKLCVAALRATAIDGINLANSGHPGASLSLAPIMYILYRDFIVANPFKPNWINRDMVVLSCGHASMLLYTILHLCGYNISIDDLKKFRKRGSITPGHPEVGVTEGIDASSGPLGQGVAQAVGIALAERMLASKYSSHLFNHYTYCICGDGCLEEGISQEAISFAGLNKLGKLILLYDANDVTLDGPLAQSDINDVKMRFEASNWEVITVKDGNNLKEIHNAIAKAKENKEKPSLIVFKTIIGYGSKNQGTCKVHGAPLGEEDGNNAKLSYEYTNAPFDIPQEVYNDFKETFIARANEKYEKYNNYYQQQKTLDADKIALLEKIYNKDLDSLIDNLKYDESLFKTDATRNVSGELLNFYHENLPFLVGGSADVASSVKTHLKNGVTYTPETQNGTNINWGIREFLMCAASNGILLHGGLRSYVGSFFVFSDYMKSAMRMASLMEVPQIFLLSHDSIAVGEDGPTHQPIEHFAMLRTIPNFNLIRPCDARETYGAYKVALKSKKTPTAIILSRQKLPLLDTSLSDGDFEKGAYIVSKANKEKPDGTIIATGSEVALAIETKNKLYEEYHLDFDIVSMPSYNSFDVQSDEYKASVLRSSRENTFSVEMASTFGWYKYSAHPYGINTFGASGNANELIEYFKFTEPYFTKFVLANLSK